MVFLDYQTTTLNNIGNAVGAVIFTAPYKCWVITEITAHIGSATTVRGGLLIDGAVPFGNNERASILSACEDDLGNTVVSCGSAVLRSGDMLRDQLNLNGAEYTVVLHYFRLPESP